MAKNRKRGPRQKNRERTTKPKVGRAVAKALILASSPLSRYLTDLLDSGESRLATVATKIAEEPFNDKQFRKEIIQKLRSLRYPQPEERGISNATFYQHLEKAKCLKTVLHRSTLPEIWQCMLIPRIVARDRHLEKEHLSAIGYPLTFHRRLVREARKRMEEADRLEVEFGETSWMKKYRQNLDQQFRENIILDLLSWRYTGSRKVLFSGQPKTQLVHSPRDEHVAARVAVYWILRTRLQESPEMSDRFVRQLSLLINAQLGDRLESDDALRHDIDDDLLGWKKVLKIPPKK